MSTGNEFITSVIVNGAIGEYVNYLKPSIFSSDPVNMLTWKVLVEYYNSYRKAPPKDYIARTCKEFEFMESDIATLELFKLLQREFVRSKVEDFTENYLVGIGEDDIDDPIEFINELHAKFGSISDHLISEEQVVHEGDSPDDVIRYYRGEIEDDSLAALSYPWGPLQRVTNGAELGEYIVFMARMGNMKTTTLLYLVAFWYLTHKKKVLILTKEMTRKSLWQLLCCVMGSIDIQKFRDKKLTQAEEETIEDIGRILTDHNRLHIIQPKSGIYGAAAVQEIARLVSFYELGQGDILAIDGVYFYSNNEVMTMRNFSSELRQYLLLKKLICVATNQGNQNFAMEPDADPGKMMNLGDGVAHDATTIIGMELNQEERELSMALFKLRQGMKTQWVIDAVPFTGFGVKFSENPQKDKDTKIPKVLDLSKMLGRPLRSNK